MTVCPVCDRPVSGDRYRGDEAPGHCPRAWFAGMNGSVRGNIVNECFAHAAPWRAKCLAAEETIKQLRDELRATKRVLSRRYDAAQPGTREMFRKGARIE